MPILQRENDIYPPTLLEDVLGEQLSTELSCWATYTLSRREKELMRRLKSLEVPHYCPLVPKRTKSPSGRIRTSYVPLFSNYVFVFGDEEQRYLAKTTGCVSQQIKVDDRDQLVTDLQQIRSLIDCDAPLTPESRLEEGQRVRVKTGSFAGYEGVVLRREGKTRLVVAVNFLQQGASVALDDCQLELI